MPSDGLAVMRAMRHAQPQELTPPVSGYLDMQAAVSAILLEADEIIVKPFEAGKLAELPRKRTLTRKPAARMKKVRVAAILQRCIIRVVQDWLARVNRSDELNQIRLSDLERAGHLPELVGDLIVRLGKSNAATRDSAGPSPAAIAHGELRYQQGYSASMLVQESRILQVTLLGTLQKNLRFLDLSLLLPDVMTIADEVDAQLTQSMEGYMIAMRRLWRRSHCMIEMRPKV